jgi:DNA recombination protein RmuC
MTETVTTVLLGFATIGIFFNLVLQFIASQKNKNFDIDQLSNALRVPTVAEIKTALEIPNAATIEVALSASLEKKGIAAQIGEFGSASKELKSVATDFNRMMLKKSSRASWGEWAMEEELKEIFSSVQIRKNVPEIGKIPDAHVRIDGKILCIDSKFILDSFEKYHDTPETKEKAREGLMKQFEKDVKGHIEKIKEDYVQPGKGTHPVAYMFIPSNSVYDFLIVNCEALIRDGASAGVIICSPMTLIANMHMLRMATIASSMSSMHAEILAAHERITKEFSELETEWGKLSNHAKNLTGKVAPVAAKVSTLSGEISGLRRLASSLTATEGAGLLPEGSAAVVEVPEVIQDDETTDGDSAQNPSSQ